MNIGLIGVGNIGMPLLKKLLKKKYNVSVLLEKNNNIFEKCLTFKENEIDNFINLNDKIISVLPNSKITYDIVNNVKNNKKNKKYWMDLCSSCPKDVTKISKKK